MEIKRKHCRNLIPSLSFRYTKAKSCIKHNHFSKRVHKQKCTKAVMVSTKHPSLQASKGGKHSLVFSLWLESSTLADGKHSSESMKPSRLRPDLDNEVLATDGIHDHRRTCSSRPFIEFSVSLFPPFVACDSSWGGTWTTKLHLYYHGFMEINHKLYSFAMATQCEKP